MLTFKTWESCRPQHQSDLCGDKDFLWEATVCCCSIFA